jgi:hypothetical protein
VEGRRPGSEKGRERRKERWPRLGKLRGWGHFTRTSRKQASKQRSASTHALKHAHPHRITPHTHSRQARTHPQAPPTGQAAPGSPHTHTHTHKPRSCTRKGSQPPRRYNAPRHAAAATGHTQGQQTTRQKGHQQKGGEGGTGSTRCTRTQSTNHSKSNTPATQPQPACGLSIRSGRTGQHAERERHPTPRTLGIGVWSRATRLRRSTQALNPDTPTATAVAMATWY